ncbi:MAG: peptidoglycan DD-metalloendopeptidase family protein [Bacteroidetes bacterium]|nr:peptidoglycan DD-metalloendopeptidase family protein [Bacteroidota bacterium]
MIFRKNIYSIAVTIIAILYINASYSQDNENNRINKKESDSLMLALHASIPIFSDIVTISKSPSSISIAKPTLKLPNKLYNTWNNKDIKINSDKAFNKNTTYVLPLINEETNHKFVFPYKGKVISPFGYRGRKVHAGTDIKLALNDEVFCAFDGEVRMAKRYSGYGNLVVVRHKNGLETCYGHLNSIKVKVNQEVKAGDLIGLGGRTGRATTTHLHFETRFLGDAFNSAKLLDYDNFTLKSDTLVIDKNTFIKSKNFKYKKNKRGKRIKVFYEDTTQEENTPVNTNTTIVYQEDEDSVEQKTVIEKRINNVNSIERTVDVADTKKDNSKATKTKKASKDRSTKKEKTRFYKVRSGDTLSKIARNNGIAVKDLCKINKINEDAILSLGKKIKLR